MFEALPQRRAVIKPLFSGKLLGGFGRMLERVAHPFDHHFTFTAAWLSALVGAVSLGVALYVAWRDRRTLAISWIPFQPTSALEFDDKQRYVVLTVANRGRRPVTLSSVGYRLRDGSRNLVLYDEFKDGPIELTEGKSVNYKIPKEDPLPGNPTGIQPTWVKPDNIMYAWVRLATGESYRGYGRRWGSHQMDTPVHERLDKLLTRLWSR